MTLFSDFEKLRSKYHAYFKLFIKLHNKLLLLHMSKMSNLIKERSYIDPFNTFEKSNIYFTIKRSKKDDIQAELRQKYRYRKKGKKKTFTIKYLGFPENSHELTYEPPHEKTNNLHMRKQRRRPASR